MTLALFNRSIFGDLYNQALSGVYRPGIRVYDPDFALLQDPEIYDKVRRDAVINHAIQLRRHLVAGRRWIMTPAGDSPKDKLAANIMEDLLNEIFQLPSALFNLSEAVIRGSAYAFIQGNRKMISVGGLNRRNWWVPSRLKDVDRRRFRQVVRPHFDKDGKVRIEWQFWNVAQFIWEPLEHPEWFVKHIYEDTESRVGYGRGLLESIYYYHYAKTVVLTEGLNACERWAQGLLHIAIDGGREASTGKPNTQLVDDWLKEMNKQKGRHIFVHDKLDEIKILDGPGVGWQIIRELLGYLDKSLVLLILGSVLPSSASEGGSFALGKVQESSREALIAFDRSLLSETITKDLCGLVWRLNRFIFMNMGITDDNMPSFEIARDQKDDSQTEATIIRALLAAGIPLRKDEVYMKTGFTPPQEDDEVIEPTPTQGGFPGGTPGLPSLPGLPGEEAGVSPFKASVPGKELVNEIIQKYKDGTETNTRTYKPIKSNGSARSWALRVRDIKDHFKTNYAKGEPCKPGETAAKSGCIPSKDGNGTTAKPPSQQIADLPSDQFAKSLEGLDLQELNKVGLNVLGDKQKQSLVDDALDAEEERLERQNKEAEQWGKGLPSEQKTAFEQWSAGGFAGIRRLQKGLPGIEPGTPKPDITHTEDELRTFTESIENAFDDAPKWEGTVHRGIQELDRETLKAILSSETIEFDALTSTTKRRDVVETKFAIVDDSIIFKIRQKGGVDISSVVFDIFQDEKEVLMKKGSRFQVGAKRLVKKRNGNEVWEMELQEV